MCSLKHHTAVCENEHVKCGRIHDSRLFLNVCLKIRVLYKSYAYRRTSDSSCARYPRPTANPPPSPATGSDGGGAAPRRRPYRHYRAMNRPPPPTPASTDACESEPEPAARAPPPSPVPSPEPTVFR